MIASLVRILWTGVCSFMYSGREVWKMTLRLTKSKRGRHWYSLILPGERISKLFEEQQVWLQFYRHTFAACSDTATTLTFLYNLDGGNVLIWATGFLAFSDVSLKLVWCIKRQWFITLGRGCVYQIKRTSLRRDHFGTVSRKISGME